MNKIVKAIERTYYRAKGYYPASINGTKYNLDPYHSRFWKKVAKGRWEPQTYKALSTFLKPDSVYWDVGSWIGPTAIFAANICKQVICFEPDPAAYRFLRWNIELNNLKNVTTFNVALSDQTSIQQMSSFGDALGDSMVSLLKNDLETETVDVLTLSWDAILDLLKIEKIDFLKIDIEGAEFALLPTLKDYLSRHRPVVHLSLHTPFLKKDSRREELQKILEVMGLYKKCLDADLKEVDIRKLDIEEILVEFPSFIFTD